MKKLILIPLIFITVFLSAFADSKNKGSDDFVQQIVLPSEVYVGDEVQLNYTFNSGVDFFTLASSKHIDGDTLYLNPALKPFADSDERYTVNEVSLHRNGMSYTLLIKFIPWVTGELTIPEFNLSACCLGKDAVIVQKEAAEDSESEGFEEQVDTMAIDSGINPAPYKIKLKPVNIISLSEKLGAVSLRPPVSPILLPGTNYIIWTLIVVGVILLFGICFVLAKIRSIQEFWYNLRERLGLIKVSKMTRRKLKKLSVKKCSDAEYAAEWQQLMRTYLDSRFGVPFSSVTTKRISSVIFNVTGGMLSELQEDAVLTIVSLFTRTDYIIFAQNSIDSKQLPVEIHEAAFNEGERGGIVESTVKAIEGLEKVEEEKEEVEA
ncbi:MAG: hypothetical protein II563_08870 [Treponema sp.]|nr:hypothetical protein [Treponema sp.]MBQ2552939.1 hypothetical protein [Treponema sp.]MBQ4236520.1 hypothetical protein [Treponema sp.]